MGVGIKATPTMATAAIRLTVTKIMATTTATTIMATAKKKWKQH